MYRMVTAFCVLAAFPLRAEEARHAQPYAGLETREIKALSEEDLSELRAGGGWGFALAAELNGVPGPAHLLELREPLGLDARQAEALQVMVAEMRAEAQAAGERFIEAERELEEAFRAGIPSAERLGELVEAASLARADLRLVHLSRHLETPGLLTQDQIDRYSELRGYGASPCDNVPAGHDPVMWRAHNGCDG